MDRREAIRRTAWMMGGIVSAPAIMGVLNGCTAKPTLNWEPAFLTKDQSILVTQVADIIIPKTDTASASEVGVPEFIDTLLKNCYDKEGQDKFVAALTTFDEGAKSAHGDAFIDLSPEDQTAYVTAKHEEALKAEGSDRPFVMTMKELTMLGYFTSEIGATQVLQYEAVPGAYHGCIPLSEAGNGKTWATS